MRRAPGVTLPVLGRDGDAVLAVRRLWASAARVDAAVSDANRLRRLLGTIHILGPRPVRLVSSRPPGNGSPPDWDWACLSHDPAPEFILFYRAGCDFPDCALMFSGGSAGEAWWTWHERPVVLQRLRERFVELRALAASGDGGTSSADGAVALVSASIGGTAGVREWRETYERPDGSKRTEAIEHVAARDLYRRVLAAHFAALDDGDERDRPAAAPALALHQRRAYERALETLERYGGVIVADAVGLGKTYVGLRLLERAVADGGRGIVIVPAALREQWSRELGYLGLVPTKRRRHEERHRARPDNLDLWLREAPPVTLVSMEALGRRGFDRAAHRGADVVVVDEAHNFRNPSTRRYQALLDLARHSRLALLTATPINNSALDLRHLIDLFAAPGAFRHLGVSDYREAFRATPEGTGTGDLSRVIAACLVRRTRRCLRAVYGAVRVASRSADGDVELRFPRRAPPQPVEYDLGGTYGDLFAGIEDWFDALDFPTASPDGNANGSPRVDAAALLKIVLLKRLESSIESFRASIVGQLAWCGTALRAIESGRVLTRPDYRRGFRGNGDDPGGQLALFELMLPTPTLGDAAMADLRRRLEADMEVLARVHGSLAGLGPRGDRKLHSLIELLDGPHAGRKILLFTEFRDTARYLHHQLRGRPHVAQIDSGGARLGLDRVPRREVIERFAPRSNGLPEPHTRERVDLLIATDVLSEGLNLQDASTVISYDLPWNPVRLMQRMGRIDRLGALADVVELHHFVPARDLDRLLGLMARLREKLGAIESAIGLDHPILAAIDVPGDVELGRVRRLAVDPREYARIEEESEGPLDPDERAYLDHVAFRESGPDAAPALRTLVAVASVHRRPDPEATTSSKPGPRRSIGAAAYWTVQLGHAERDLWLICDPRTGSVLEDQATALDLFRGAQDSPAAAVDEATIASARRACARYARAVASRLRAARIAGDALRPGLPQSRIAAWLGRYFEEHTDRLQAAERERVDDLLDRLGRRFTLAGERALSRLAESLPSRPSAAAFDELSSTVAGLATDEDQSISVQEIALLIVT